MGYEQMQLCEAASATSILDAPPGQVAHSCCKGLHSFTALTYVPPMFYWPGVEMRSLPWPGYVPFHNTV